MKDKSGFLILAGILLFFSRCNFDVDTSDPQASSSIMISKKNNLFLSEYKSTPNYFSIFKIREAWIEKSWRNQLNYWQVVKEETGGNQLNLILDSFINPKFKNDEYILNWRMEDNVNGSLGKSGNVYSLFLKEQYLPDTFNITIEQINEDRTTKNLDTFKIIKK